MTEDWNWKPNLPGLLRVLKLVSWRHIPHRIKELNSAECISFSLFSADYDSWSQQIFWQWNIITHVKVGVWTHFHSYSLQPDYLNIWHLIYRHSSCLWTHLMHILGMLLCCTMVKGKTSHPVFYLTGAWASWSYKHEYCRGSPVSNTPQDCLDSTHACNSQRPMPSSRTRYHTGIVHWIHSSL